MLIELRKKSIGRVRADGTALYIEIDVWLGFLFQSPQSRCGCRIARPYPPKSRTALGFICLTRLKAMIKQRTNCANCFPSRRHIESVNRGFRNQNQNEQTVQVLKPHFVRASALAKENGPGLVSKA